MLSRVGLAISVIGLVCVWLCCVAPASCEVDPLAETILAQQTQYFRSIVSLELHQVMTLTVNEELRKLRQVSSVEKQESCIVVDGARYLSEVKFEDGETLASAFDGNDYQVRDLGSLALSKRSMGNNPYLVLTVLTTPFDFAFGDDDVRSIDGLRNPELWARLLQAVVSTSKASMLGHEGTLLKFSSPDNPDKAFEVFFAEDLSELPIYSRMTLKDWISELTVLDTITISRKGSGLVIPTRVSIKEYSPDKVYGQVCTLQAISEPLKVNQPIDQDMFTLPRTNVKTINYADFDLLVPASARK